MNTADSQRGWALLELGRDAEAESTFRRYLAGQPDDPHALEGLADALLAQDRPAEALTPASDAVRIDPQSAGALHTISRAHLALGDYPRAHQAALAALEIAPHHPSLHLQLALVLAGMGNEADGVEHAERACQLNPSDPSGPAILGALLFDMGEHDRAAAAIDRALALDPNHSFALSMRGRLALVHRGGSRPAVAAARAALRLDPQNSDRREQAATALKSRNPLYLALLRLSNRLAQSGRGALLFTFAPMIVINMLRPAIHQLWAQILIGLMVAIVALSHLLDPLMNLVLMTTRYGRSLIDRRDRTAALLAGALVVIGTPVAVLSAVRHSGELFALAMAALLWSFVAGGMPNRPRRWTLLISAVVVAALAIALSAALVLGGSTAAPVTALALIGGIVGTWYVSFSGAATRS